MANSKITWANKESLVTDPTIAEKNKVTDSNMNEIKSVVNENADQTIVSDTEPTSADNEIWVDTSSNATYINSEISNEYGTSQNLGYSQEYINKFTNYSTTEQVIGKWVNGKLVYRKVVDYLPTEIIGAAGTTTNIQVPHNISNFGQITDCRVVTGTNHVFPTLSSSTGSTLTAGNAVIQVNSTNIIFRIINDSWSSRHFYFILEYTKTTD